MAWGTKFLIQTGGLPLIAWISNCVAGLWGVRWVGRSSWSGRMRFWLSVTITCGERPPEPAAGEESPIAKNTKFHAEPSKTLVHAEVFKTKRVCLQKAGTKAGHLDWPVTGGKGGVTELKA